MTQRLLFSTTLLGLLLLGSCGAQKSSTTLKVSSGFAMLNSTYSGGLVVVGKSHLGQSFSIPMLQNAGSNNEVTLELPRGKWTFGAVGWDGSLMESTTPKCAALEADLTNDAQVVDLAMSSAACTHTIFGQNNINQDFKKLHLITCGTLHPAVNSAPLISDNPNFCKSTGSLPPDLRRHAKSAVINVLSRMPGQESKPSALNRCIDLTDGTLLSSLKLPARMVPIKIDLHEESCSSRSNESLITSYHMEESFGFEYPGMDKKVFHVSGSSNLYLVANNIKKGYSSFLNIMPEIKCDGTNPCLLMPMLPSVDLYLSEGQEFVLSEDINVSCAGLTSVGVTWNASPGFDCRQDDHRVLLRLHSIPATCEATVCTLSTNLTSSKSFLSDNPAKASVTKTYSTILKTLGHTPTLTPNIHKSLPILGEKEAHYFGELSRVRDLFSSDGPAGLFGWGLTSATDRTESITFWEEGEEKTYQVRIKPLSTSLPIPHYICNDNNLTPGICTDIFTHQMTISRVLPPQIIPEEEVYFIPGKKVGASLAKRQEDKDNKSFHSRVLTYWNTQVQDRGRFEVYRIEEEKNYSGDLLHVHTAYVRAERENTLNQGNTNIVNLDFHSKLDSGGNYEQWGEKKEIILKDDRMQMSQQEAFLRGSSLSYFSDEYLKEYNQRPADARKSYARSPDGSNQIEAWSEYVAANNYQLQIKYKLGTANSWQVKTFAVGAKVDFIPEVKIDNLGTMTLAWVQKYTSDYRAYILVENGSGWRYYPSSGLSIDVANAISPFGPDAFFDSQTYAFKITLVDEGTNKAVLWTYNSASPATKNNLLKAGRISPSQWLTSHNTIHDVGATNEISSFKAKFNGTNYDIALLKNGEYLKFARVSDLTATISFNVYGAPLANAEIALLANDATSTRFYISNTANPTQPLQVLQTTDGITATAIASFSSNNISLSSPRTNCLERNSSTIGVVQSDCTGLATSNASPIKNSFSPRLENLNPNTFSNIFNGISP
jgi:hypothetical protein